MILANDHIQRSHQLTARGKDELLIDTVAENMLRWTRIQSTLSEQLSQAREFVSQYQKFSETRQFSDQINETIDSLERDVSNQIDKLEQTFRDLLQIVSGTQRAQTTTNDVGICLDVDQRSAPVNEPSNQYEEAELDNGSIPAFI